MDIIDFIFEQEKITEPSFQNIKVICEATMSETQFERIQSTLVVLFQKYERNQKTLVEQFWSMAPKTALLFTVTFAIHNYEGNYWGKLRNTLHLKEEGTWKECFIHQLEKQKLTMFPRNSAQRYINNVLGHAGIPKSNIHEFINSVLEPAIENNMDVDEVLQAFRIEDTKTPIKMYGLYKSVIDFMKIQHSVSRNLVERCLTAWEEQVKPFTENYKGYLPNHILQGFDDYSDTDIEKKKKYNSNQNKLERPNLFYSPEYQNVYIHLPIQKFQNTAPYEVRWEIEKNDEISSIETKKIVYQNQEVEFLVNQRRGEIPVKPHSTYRVRLFMDGEQVGEWVFRIGSHLIFDRKNYKQIRTQFIQAKSLIIICHNEETKTIEKDDVTYSYHSMSGFWTQYSEYDISIKKSVNLNFSDGTVIIQPKSQVMSIGGRMLEDCTAEQSILTDGSYLHFNIGLQDIQRVYSPWHLKIEQQNRKTSKRFQLKDCNLISDGTKITKLDLRPLLDQLQGDLFGEYRISLSGELGGDEKLGFYFISHEEFHVIKKGSRIEFQCMPPIKVQMTDYLECNHQDGIYSTTLANDLTANKFEVVHTETLENIAIKYYPNKIALQLKQEEEWISLDDVVPRTRVSFTRLKVLLDLENPLLPGQSFEVRIFEPLKGNSITEKNYTCRSGRKHALDLSYFESVQGSNLKRQLFIEIPLLGIRMRLLTIETDWDIVKFEHKSNEIVWETSMNVENLLMRIWHFDSEKTLIQEFAMDHNLPRLQLGALADGIYIVEFDERETNDFLSMFDEIVFPTSLSKHTRLIRVGAAAYCSAAKFLLLNEKLTGGDEWEKKQLTQLIDHLSEYEVISIPLLFEDYDSCCDFGIRNIDNLIEINRETNKIETPHFIRKIAGIHELDFETFKLLNTDSYLPTTQAKYVPDYYDGIIQKTLRERMRSYQELKQEEQFIKGFSLPHEYLRLIYKFEIDDNFKKTIQVYLDQASKIDELFQSLIKEQLISGEVQHLVKQRLIIGAATEHQFIYYVGIVAMASALTHFKESQMSNGQLIVIRQSIPPLFEVAHDWLYHDLLYWKTFFSKEVENTKLKEERRRTYVHPSFAWKE